SAWLLPRPGLGQRRKPPGTAALHGLAGRPPHRFRPGPAGPRRRRGRTQRLHPPRRQCPVCGTGQPQGSARPVPGPEVTTHPGPRSTTRSIRTEKVRTTVSTTPVQNRTARPLYVRVGPPTVLLCVLLATACETSADSATDTTPQPETERGHAQEAGLEVSQAWIPEPANPEVGALYLEISNDSDEDDALVAVTTDASEEAELHTTETTESGAGRMREVA